MENKFGQAIEQLKEDLHAVALELQASPSVTKMFTILRTLNGLEELAGVEKTSLSNVFFGENVNGSSESTPHKYTVKFDEFVGMKPLSAAQQYLQKYKDARPFGEILAAVNSGSGKTLSTDEEKMLRRSLTRSTLKIMKIGDRFGDLRNYEEIREKRKKKHKKVGVGFAISGTPVPDKDDVDDEVPIAEQPTIRKRSRIKERG